MRNKKMIHNDPALLAELASACEIGHLALVTPKGEPRSIALNFAISGHAVIFHGALTGEKYEAIAAGGTMGFTIARPYSVIPSYWIGPKYASTATHYFKSVEIRGQCSIITDTREKIAGLQALMDKYQPEGGYDAIDPQDPAYASALDHVGVFSLSIDSWTGKRKFGQGKPEKMLHDFIDQLRMRGGPMDKETAEEIRKDL